MMRQIPNAGVRSTLNGVTLVARVDPHLIKVQYNVSLTGNHCAATVTLVVH